MPLLQVRECPEDIYRKITYAAKSENRTIAQQIIVLLEKALGQEESNILDKSMQNTIIILPTAIVIILVISWINMASIRARQEMPDKDMAIGRSKARLIDEDENNIRFDNVAGIEEEKGELKEIVDFLKNPQKYIEMGARIPKGVLLVGRPGTR